MQKMRIDIREDEDGAVWYELMLQNEGEKEFGFSRSSRMAKVDGAEVVSAALMNEIIMLADCGWKLCPGRKIFK